MSGLKSLFVLVLLLGVAGAVVYAVRARRTSSEPDVAAHRHVHDEDDESATEMRVREAGSATA